MSNNLDAEFKDMVIDCLGCKWTLKLLDEIQAGTRRPAHLVKSVPGLSTKVLNQNLRKMQQYQLIARQDFAEVPPRVEYTLTPFGQDMLASLNNLNHLSRSFHAVRDSAAP